MPIPKTLSGDDEKLEEYEKDLEDAKRRLVAKRLIQDSSQVILRYVTTVKLG